MAEQNVEATVFLRLNSVGFKGSDIDEVFPDFATNRQTTVGLSWAGTAEGPCQYILLIALSIPLTLITNAFLSELGKDLYKWSKSKLIPMLLKKRDTVGHISVEFPNITLYLFLEEVRKGDLEMIARLFEDLPKIVKRIDPSRKGEWSVSWDEKTKEWELEGPNNS